jgi:Zn-dependent protease
VEDLRTFLLTLPVLLAAMVLHELAHGVVALRLGDPTAKMMGRLTLNPIRHLDPLGTAMFAFTFLAGLRLNLPGFAVGWAKPVPVVPAHFRSPQRGMALVAAAGPLTNLAVAAVFAAILLHVTLSGTWFDVALLALLVNVTLFLFNLLPVPPLDGGRILSAILPAPAARLLARAEGVGFVVVLLVVLNSNLVPRLVEPVLAFFLRMAG